MKKVTGTPSYEVNVYCPECDFWFDAIEQEDDSEITIAMFGNTTETCTNMDIHLVCPRCDCEMILDKLEY